MYIYTAIITPLIPSLSSEPVIFHILDTIRLNQKVLFFNQIIETTSYYSLCMGDCIRRCHFL